MFTAAIHSQASLHFHFPTVGHIAFIDPSASEKRCFQQGIYETPYL
jgi:hypothetical protein